MGIGSADSAGPGGRKAAEHGKKVHGMTEIPPDMLAKARSLIREEAA